MADSVAELQARLTDFAAARDWEQFHAPKNLCMALSGEVGELLEHFQWLTTEQSEQLDDETLREVGLEMADVFIYLLRLAERLDVDLVAVANEKTDINEKRFPVERVHGKAGRGSDFA